MAAKLLDSFGAVYLLLERPAIARRAVAVVLVIHTFLLAYSAYVHSPTLNEPGHLVAGLSHWKFGRFDVYNVNPPLVKMVAALPVMVAGYEEDWSGFYEGSGARPEFRMGEDFVAANGEQSFFLFMIVRWACIPFSWIGAITCFCWSRDLYGRPAGVLAACIWCFEPNILAHASLMTPDAHATALGLAACYTFWRWLKSPTWGQTALTGVVLGVAELAKTTLILLYPIWPLMWLIDRWPDRHSMFARDWLRETGMLALRMVVGLYVLNLGYGFEGSFTRLKEFHFVSNLFTGPVDHPPSSIQHQESGIQTHIPTNRFAGELLGELPVPFPKNYLVGIDVQQSDFEDYGRPSYLRGEWRDHGWWYYYLYACSIKVPLGLWLLGFLAMVCGLPRWKNRPTEKMLPSANSRQQIASARDQFILLFPAIVIFTVVSSKTGINEHMRYVLPAFPYFFIAISQLAQVFALSEKTITKIVDIRARRGYKSRVQHRGSYLQPTPERRMAILQPLPVATLLSWFIASSLFIYPHSLSYFNESICGPLNGTKHLLGSNIDWGQDLRYVKVPAHCNGQGNLGDIIQFAFPEGTTACVMLKKTHLASGWRDTNVCCDLGPSARTNTLATPSVRYVIVSVNRLIADHRRTLRHNAISSLPSLKQRMPIRYFGYTLANFEVY